MSFNISHSVLMQAYCACKGDVLAPHTMEIPEPVSFLSRRIPQIWGLLVYPVMKIKSVVHQVRNVTCIYCGLKVKINVRKTLQDGCLKIVDAFVLHLFLRVWMTKPKDPQFDDAITQQNSSCSHCAVTGQ